ncbi:helix-turn-helix transcriptional regulator [Candidatus Dependentiae bacterium]|nr:helix-turn-helix transcriptional regulator [Candidatus Dependentiae bacterium]
MNVLGEYIHSLKRRKKITSQTDFAEKVGYNRSYISDLVNNSKELPDKLLDKIQQVFGENPTEVVSDANNKNDNIKQPKKTGFFADLQQFIDDYSGKTLAELDEEELRIQLEIKEKAKYLKELRERKKKNGN